MNLIDNTAQEIRKKTFPTEQENKVKQMQQMFQARKKFMAAMVEFVENSVSEKKKMVRMPITKREDIPKLRRLIKRIANNLGLKVKSVKKRWVVVENTKFIVEKIPKVKYTIEGGQKLKKKCKYF